MLTARSVQRSSLRTQTVSRRIAPLRQSASLKHTPLRSLNIASRQRPISSPIGSRLSLSTRSFSKITQLLAKNNKAERYITRPFGARSSFVTRNFSSAATATEPVVIELPVSPDVPRGESRVPLKLEVGDIVHGFKVVNKSRINERDITVYHLVHERTGAEHVHLECDDLENAFCVSFKTIPEDDSGMPHVLEHLVLCGSQNFPVRDPFFEMNKRSLSTYMNAWTGPDYTSYPFSTQNVKDFYNLMAVYLDAVYRPKLEYLDFLQEGVRLHVDSETQEISYRGVVYNEMKGVVSDPGDQFMTILHNKLDPEYPYNYGGNPPDIRKSLDYEKLKSFHKRYYHPSNSYTITYGDLPLEPHLRFISERVLDAPEFSQRGQRATQSQLGYWNEPRKLETTKALSPLTDANKQTIVAVGWLLNDITDIYESFVIDFISTLLVDGAPSPFYKALISSNLGSTYSPGTGYYGHCRRGVFSVGLSDVADENVENIEKIIMDTLEEVVRTGFPEDRITSVFHRIELYQREIKTGFGISLISRVLHKWMHGASPCDAISLTRRLDRLREDLEKDPTLLQKKVKQYFLDNPHRLTLIMRPDAEYNNKQANEETEAIESIKSTLTPEKMEQITKLSEELTQRQEMQNDPNLLPKLTLADIDRRIPRLTLHHDTLSDVRVQWAPQPTNGLVYFRAKLMMNDLPQHLLPYIPLFSSALTQTGAGDMDYIQFEQMLDKTVWNFYATPSVLISPTETGKYDLSFLIQSSCLETKVDKMFSLWEMAASAPRFKDYDRLRTLIRIISGNMHDSLYDSGHSYALLLAGSSIIPSYKIRELWSGYSQYKFISALEKKDDMEEVAARMQEILEHIVAFDNIACAINSEEKHFTSIKGGLDKFLKSLRRSVKQAENKDGDTFADIATTGKSTFLTLPLQVNYVAKVLPSVHYTHPDFAALEVMSRILTNDYLHNEIREKGGAYGSGAGSQNHALSLYSYRDPHLQRTIDAFAQAPEWLHSIQDWDRLLEAAKLSIIGDLDAPVPPRKKGTQEFYLGITHEMRQERRERLLDVTPKDVLRVADKYLRNAPSSIAVVGKEEVAQELKDNPEWQVI